MNEIFQTKNDYDTRTDKSLSLYDLFIVKMSPINFIFSFNFVFELKRVACFQILFQFYLIFWTVEFFAWIRIQWRIFEYYTRIYHDKWPWITCKTLWFLFDSLYYSVERRYAYMNNVQHTHTQTVDCRNYWNNLIVLGFAEMQIIRSTCIHSFRAENKKENLHESVLHEFCQWFRWKKKKKTFDFIANSSVLTTHLWTGWFSLKSGRTWSFHWFMFALCIILLGQV